MTITTTSTFFSVYFQNIHYCDLLLFCLLIMWQPTYQRSSYNRMVASDVLYKQFLTSRKCEQFFMHTNVIWIIPSSLVLIFLLVKFFFYLTRKTMLHRQIVCKFDVFDPSHRNQENQHWMMLMKKMQFSIIYHVME